mgnify:CR=1 FL=1
MIKVEKSSLDDLYDIYEIEKSVFNNYWSELSLRKELENKGIDLEYHYGVIDSSNGSIKILNADNKEDAEEIKSSPLKANLFPMDLMEKNYLLSIDFPNEKNYLMKQALLPLSASGILMFIVVGCFAYAIMVILRQKKLSEMDSKDNESSQEINCNYEEIAETITQLENINAYLYSIEALMERIFDVNVSENIELKFKEIAEEIAPDPLNIDRLILNRLFHQTPDFPDKKN